MVLNSSSAPLRQQKNIIVFVLLGPDYTPVCPLEQILERTGTDTFLHFGNRQKAI
ncbi:MAG: hypothetical protein ACN6O6_05355 [Pseudomonas sp.]|uniref:hypothetical protein n=1 Tax=Pseudomonas sp. TaxID=306 RepID=UPI003D1072CD